MAAPEFDQSKPSIANSYDTDVDQMRDNYVYLLILAAAAAFMLPKWTTTVQGSDKSQPDSITMTYGLLGMKFIFTWSSGSVQSIKYQFDKGLGDGFEDIYLGTLTISYDSSGNFTGAIPS